MKACTIVARNYLPYARVLAESFTAHHPSSRLTVLVIDDLSRRVQQASEPFDVLHLDAIASDTRELHRQALLYSVTEMATAVKPLLLRHLLASGHDAVMYLDPDICVYAPLDDIAALAAEHSIVLTPHTTEPMARDGRRPTEADILASGVFNLGFLGLGPGSEVFLDWWQARLRRDCVIDHQRMLFTDQRWIDFVPGYFRHLVLRDPTANVAYWNVDRRRLAWSGEGYELEGRPLRFFHFSGFSPWRSHLLSVHQGANPRVLLSERPDVADLCADYARRLQEAGLQEDGGGVTYGWDRLPNGLRVDSLMRSAYRQALIKAESEGGVEPPDAFDPATTEAFLAWLNEPVGRPAASVTRYLLALWSARPDLQVAFPDPTGADGERFVAWVRVDGVQQAGIPTALYPVPRPPDPLPAPSAPPTRPGVNVVGYFRSVLGVGEGGRLLVSILEAAGTPHASFVYDVTASRQDHPFVERGGRDAPHELNVLCINADRVRAFADEVGPSFFEGRHTVGMWAWEVEDFPMAMRSGFDVVDEVWAVSEFAAAAIRRVSRKPVYALPHPVIPPVVRSTLSRGDLGLPEGRPLFAFMFDLLSVIERKNPFAVIEAFVRAFAPGEGPLLVIKTINGPLRIHELEQLRATAARHPDVVVLDRHLSADDRTAFLALADCYVSLHRAEGFGLTMAEAMALGKPVVATRYSGNLEFMDDRNSFLVDAHLVPIPPGIEPYPAGCRWAEPDVAAAAALLRLVVDDPEAAAARGRQAAVDMRERHSPAARVAFVRQRLAAISALRGPAVPARPAPPTFGLDELAGQRAVGPGEGAPVPRLRQLARRAVTRATRPSWWGPRAVDGSILEALQEAEAARQRERSVDGAASAADVQAVVHPLQERVAGLEADLGALGGELAAMARRLDQPNEVPAGAVDEPHVSGGLDLPVEGPVLPRGAVEITGWAFTAPPPLSQVEIVIDGRRLGPARLGLPRRDVEALHPVADAAGAGFSRVLDLSDLPGDATEVRVTAAAITTAGDRLALPSRRVRLAAAPSGEDQPRRPEPVRRPRLAVVRPASPSGGVRLLAFSHDLGQGGAQSYLLDLLRRLQARPGVTCAVLSPQDGPLRAALEDARIEVRLDPVPLDHEASYDEHLDALAARASKDGVTAILANTVHSFAGVDLAERLAIPSLWSIHESYGRAERSAAWAATGMHPAIQRRAHRALSIASVVTFVSAATRQLYLGQGETSRFLVVPNAVDLVRIDAFAASFDRPSARAALGLDQGDAVVVCIGSIEPRKGQAVLVRALQLIGAERPEARLVLVGDVGGEYSEALQRYAVAAGLGRRLVTVPHTPDVLAWHGVADVFACPSDNESLPGVVLEAAALRVPVVAARVFGIPDVIDDGRTGYLCEASDVRSLASALRRALGASSAERSAVTVAARRRVEQHHDAVQREERIWALLEELTDRARPDAASAE